MIGEVKLDQDERALLMLPPKFATRRKLDTLDMRTDFEMGAAKVRYQIHKEDSYKEIEEEENVDENICKRRRQLAVEETEDMDKMDMTEAEGRRVYDPISMTFDHGNKHCTDLAENTRVVLPKPCDQFTESSIELIRNRVMKVFEEFKLEKCNKKGEQKSNLTASEQRGLRKLRKRIANHEILVLKTDKSGKLAVINRDYYTKLGLDKCREDRRIDRESVRQIERRINDQSKFWVRMLNSGINHNQTERIMKSKVCSPENPAPKHFMYKDHKVEGGYRPVVGGCNSDTLGLSNTLSEICLLYTSPSPRDS